MQPGGKVCSDTLRLTQGRCPGKAEADAVCLFGMLTWPRSVHLPTYLYSLYKARLPQSAGKQFTKQKAKYV